VGDKKLAEHGGDRKSEVVRQAKSATPLKEPAGNQGRQSTLNGKRDSTYLTRRIARDHPKILEQMKAGKFKSVRAAAKAAVVVLYLGLHYLL